MTVKELKALLDQCPDELQTMVQYTTAEELRLPFIEPIRRVDISEQHENLGMIVLLVVDDPLLTAY